LNWKPAAIFAGNQESQFATLGMNQAATQILAVVIELQK